jgi:hypothetical protein
MKKLFMLIFSLLLVAPFLLAQDTVTLEIDNNLIAAILGAWGIGVIGLSELLKQLLKKAGYDEWPLLLRHISMYIVTLAVTAAATAFTLIKFGEFEWGEFALYTIIVWGIANGIWKGGRNAIRKAVESNSWRFDPEKREKEK